MNCTKLKVHFLDPGPGTHTKPPDFSLAGQRLTMPWRIESLAPTQTRWPNSRSGHSCFECPKRHTRRRAQTRHTAWKAPGPVRSKVPQTIHGCVMFAKTQTQTHKHKNKDTYTHRKKRTHTQRDKQTQARTRKHKTLICSNVPTENATGAQNTVFKGVCFENDGGRGRVCSQRSWKSRVLRPPERPAAPDAWKP